MKLHQCTPTTFREGVSQICKEISPEHIATGLAFFAIRHKGIVKKITQILYESSSENPPGIFINDESHLLVAQYEDFRSYMLFVLELFRRPDLTGLEDNTPYEGIALVTALSRVTLDQIRSVFDESTVFECKEVIDELTLDVYRFMAVLYVFFLLEDTSETDDTLPFPEENDDDDDDDDDDDWRNDGDDDDQPDFSGPGQYVRGRRSHRKQRELVTV
jgi:hypothetical protein